MVTREEIPKALSAVGSTSSSRQGRDGANKKEMAQINEAYETLMKYIERFRFRFDEEEMARYHPEGHYARQFTHPDQEG